MNKIITDEIKTLIIKEGGTLVGYADIQSIKDRFHLPEKILKDLDFAISIGVRLNSEILRTNIDAPSLLYKHHYRYINGLLDRIAYKVAELILSHRHRAIPIPASIIIDWQNYTGHVPHKEVAYLAGLGWRGKNNLLINKQYGASIRLATVLTDLRLEPARPVEEGCGSCRACQLYCPVGAIKDSQEEFERSKCFQKVREFSHKIGVGICGLCLSHCPQR